VISILHEASRTAGAAMVLLGVSCRLMGMCGIVGTLNVAGDPRGPAALRLARTMAVMTGCIGLVGAMVAVPYYWMLGQLDGHTLVITEMTLLAVTAVWAVVTSMLIDRQDERAENR
jgi:hypothetical protein